MFKDLRNEALISFQLQTLGPVCVKGSNQGGLDPLVPDMQVIRTSVNGQMTPFIPGSSLKGLFRSRADQIARAVGLSADQVFAGQIQDKQFENKTGTQRYKVSDPTIQLFGSTYLASRISFADAFPMVGERLVTGERPHVAIDRITGAAKLSGKQGALFSSEVIEQGVFSAQIVLTNYALWQLILVGYILQDLHDGFILVGGCTSRGYGRMTIHEVQVALREYRPNTQNDTICGYHNADCVNLSGLEYQKLAFRWQANFDGIEPLLNLSVDIKNNYEKYLEAGE